MTESELRAAIAEVINGINDAANKPRSTPEDQRFAAVLVGGAMVLGEAFIDLKRSADALESIAKNVGDYFGR